MGIYNRDYFRDENSSGWKGQSGGPWAVWQRILAITIGVYLVQLLIIPFTGYFELSVIEVAYQGQVWRLLSYAFLHAVDDVFHLLFNMLFLYLFGRRLESMLGQKEFTLFYLASAIFSGLTFLTFYLFYYPNSSVIGASGAIMSLVILYALYFPREKLSFLGIFDIEMKYFAGGYVLLNVFPLISELQGLSPEGRTSYVTHLGGILFAWIYYSQKLRLSSWLDSLTGLFKPRKKASRAPLKIYKEEEPAEGHIEAEVDRILQKIQDHGEASLTDKERKVLKQGSEYYKNRKK